MKLSDLTSEYLNKEHVRQSDSVRLLTLLMDYWATERDYEIKGQLLKQLVLKYSLAERKLAELNRVKNRFLGIAAHDLRNPLASIRGLSEILIHELNGSLTEDQQEYLSTIYAASNGMLTLVNDILDISAIESGGLELRVRQDSLKRVLRERILIHKTLADAKNISICHRLSDLPCFPFDRNRIAQVIDNVLGNAIKFTAAGRRIYVSLRRHEAAAKVSVRDEGPGIPENELPKLFEEFQPLSVQPTGGEKSTGLGLAIAKKLVDEHSGSFEVRSKPGLGSTFSFSIPMEEYYGESEEAASAACGG